jgi:AcrR family transcriptional regulator
MKDGSTMSDTRSARVDEARPTSLRERKKQLTQAAIEEAALRLFQERGYEQTSIQDIADTVMVSARTFFRYFSSKEEVLLGPMRLVLNESLRFLQELAPTESLHAMLRATFLHLAGLYQQRRTSFLRRYQVAVQTPSIATIYLYALLETEPLICDALLAHPGLAVGRSQIRLLVAVYMAALRVALEVWLEQGAQEDLVTVLRRYLDALALGAGLRALTPEEQRSGTDEQLC